jgi:hypothetical protein
VSRLLIAGGKLDANLDWLASAAQRLGVACELVLVDADELPVFSWPLGEGAPTVGGRRIEATAAFVRYDVFSTIATRSQGASASAQAWFATFTSWCAIAGLFSFNQRVDFATGSKLAMLAQAARFGIPVPRTVVTNSADAVHGLGDPMSYIAKPVAGGSYVMGLDEALQSTQFERDLSPSPAIVQPRLAYPERRIYRIGNECFAFDIRAATIDSRLDAQGGIAPFPIDQLPRTVVEGLSRLTDELRCDFCAIDMKTDPATGELVFLELNNGPMFMGYDQTCGGAMAEAMVRYLVAGGAAQAAGLGGS